MYCATVSRASPRQRPIAALHSVTLVLSPSLCSCRLNVSRYICVLSLSRIVLDLLSECEHYQKSSYKRPSHGRGERKGYCRIRRLVSNRNNRSEGEPVVGGKKENRLHLKGNKETMYRSSLEKERKEYDIKGRVDEHRGFDPHRIIADPQSWRICCPDSR